MVTSRAQGDVFAPEHLDLMQRIFVEACLERGIYCDDQEAQDLAETIILLFRSGIMTEADLNVDQEEKEPPPPTGRRAPA